MGVQIAPVMNGRLIYAGQMKIQLEWNLENFVNVHYRQGGCYIEVPYKAGLTVSPCEC